ncbi:MAG: transcriptional regulator [Candidatus Levybacteria bacterium]|nr:transcriptional regulator [Candidatus Levybacteria bacterium]
MLGSNRDKAIQNEVQNKELDEFVITLLKMDSKDKMRDFLEGILTPKELIELPNRLAIVRMLKRGISQHDVAGKLRVGVATVGRGSRELQKGRFQYV